MLINDGLLDKVTAEAKARTRPLPHRQFLSPPRRGAELSHRLAENGSGCAFTGAAFFLA